MMWLCGVQCQLRAKPYVEPDGANLTVMVVFVTIHKERGAWWLPMADDCTEKFRDGNSQSRGSKASAQSQVTELGTFYDDSSLWEP